MTDSGEFPVNDDVLADINSILDLGFDCFIEKIGDSHESTYRFWVAYNRAWQELYYTAFAITSGKLDISPIEKIENVLRNIWEKRADQDFIPYVMIACVFYIHRSQSSNIQNMLSCDYPEPSYESEFTDDLAELCKRAQKHSDDGLSTPEEKAEEMIGCMVNTLISDCISDEKFDTEEVLLVFKQIITGSGPSPYS